MFQSHIFIAFFFHALKYSPNQPRSLHHRPTAQGLPACHERKSSRNIVKTLLNYFKGLFKTILRGGRISCVSKSYFYDIHYSHAANHQTQPLSDEPSQYCCTRLTSARSVPWTGEPVTRIKNVAKLLQRVI